MQLDDFRFATYANIAFRILRHFRPPTRHLLHTHDTNMEFLQLSGPLLDIFLFFSKTKIFRSHPCIYHAWDTPFWSGTLVMFVVCGVVATCGAGATRGVTVSMSAFLACHQCYCAGSSLVWGLNLQAVVCGIFWSSSPGVFSGYSGFLPTFIGLMIQPTKYAQVNAISTLSNLVAELSLRTKWHVT